LYHQAYDDASNRGWENPEYSEGVARGELPSSWPLCRFSGAAEIVGRCDGLLVPTKARGVIRPMEPTEGELHGLIRLR
jgi:hypothetical protein